MTNRRSRKRNHRSILRTNDINGETRSNKNVRRRISTHETPRSSEQNACVNTACSDTPTLKYNDDNEERIDPTESNDFSTYLQQLENDIEDEIVSGEASPSSINSNIDHETDSNLRAADDETLDLTNNESQNTLEEPISRAEQLRIESENRRAKRRQKSTTPRTKTSVWTTVAIKKPLSIDTDFATCAICDRSIKVSLQSSSNIVSHYKNQHRKIYLQILSCDNVDSKRKVIVGHIQNRKSQSTLNSFVKTKRVTVGANVSLASKTIVRRLCGLFLISSRQLSFEFLGAPELEAFVDAAGGSIDRSKSSYLALLPDAYDAIAKLSSCETEAVNVGSITYDGWTPKFNGPTSGLTFHFIDRTWKLRSFPICFFDTVDLGKSSEDHRQIIQAAVDRSDKVGKNVLIFSATSDNEPAVALAIDRYLNFSGSVRCICHSLSLSINDACESTPFLVKVLDKIRAITMYVNQRGSTSSKLIYMQCKDHGRDRVVTLDNAFFTRWHSKLNVMEKYIAIEPYLKKVLPQNGSQVPPLLTKSEGELVAECIHVLREVRRVARCLEADRRVSGSRLPRLLFELTDTLALYGSDILDRDTVTDRLTNLMNAKSTDDKSLHRAREIVISSAKVQSLARTLRTKIVDRVGHLISPVVREDAEFNIKDEDEEVQKKYRHPKQALLLHVAALFDVNECNMEWIGSEADRSSYVNILLDAAVRELPNVLGKSFDANANYKQSLATVHCEMRKHLQSNGRMEANAALEWWNSIENGSVTDLRNRNLLLAPLFIDLARAFLCIQASSASIERVFGDAGYQEGSRRQHTQDSVTEMLFLIRSFVKSRIESATRQTEFLSRRANGVKELAEEIAKLIEQK